MQYWHPTGSIRFRYPVDTPDWSGTIRGVAGDASFWYKQSEADDYLEAWVPNGGGRQ